MKEDFYAADATYSTRPSSRACGAVPRDRSTPRHSISPIAKSCYTKTRYISSRV